MNSIKSKGLQAILAATVAAAVVTPVAIAGAEGPAATGSATAGTKQLNALKKQTAALKKQAAAFASRVAELEAKTVALEGRQFPASLPPSGRAGGDLTQSYPNPQLGPNVVGSAEIADATVGAPEIADAGVTAAEILDGTVGTAEIGDNTIQSTDLAAGAVHGGGLGEVVLEPSAQVRVQAGETVSVGAECPAGGRLLSGGYEWKFRNNGSAIIASAPDLLNATRRWAVEARVDGGGVANDIVALAYCLLP